MSFIVGISGGSGSGKTTLAIALQQALGERSRILLQDSYYIDQSKNFKGDGSVNFDHPNSLEFSLIAEHLDILRSGGTIQVPVYDFATHTRKQETQLFKPVEFIILDGTLLLSQGEIRNRLDLSIFVEANEDLRFDRRLSRDVAERGRSPEGVRKQFHLHVKPMHDEFVEPSKVHADLIFPGDCDIDDSLNAVLRHLKI